VFHQVRSTSRDPAEGLRGKKEAREGGGGGKRAKHNPPDIARPPDECASCVRGATQKEGGFMRARARLSLQSACTRYVALAPLCIIQWYARFFSPPSFSLPLFSLCEPTIGAAVWGQLFSPEIGIRVRRNTRHFPLLIFHRFHRCANGPRFKLHGIRKSDRDNYRGIR